MKLRIINIHGIGSPRRTLEDGEAAYWIQEDAWKLLVQLAASGDYGPKEQFHFTFDDGNLSDFDIGAPLLEAHGFKGEFFPLAGRMDTEGSLSSDNLKELVARGHSIGSHGHDHINWRNLDDAVAHMEIDAARDAIAVAAGAPIEAAAIPFGAYDKAVLARLKIAGFKTVYTSDGGAADGDAWLQPRTSVQENMDQADIKRLLRGDESVKRKLRRVAAMAKKRML